MAHRRRADIRHYLDTDTSFPKRLDKEETYAFSPEYRKLFNDVIQFAREFVIGPHTLREHPHYAYCGAVPIPPQATPVR